MDIEPNSEELTDTQAWATAQMDLQYAKLNKALDAVIALLEKCVADIEARTNG